MSKPDVIVPLQGAAERRKTVFERMLAVTAALAETGIAKDRPNKDQNYKFRGIDDVYNAISRLLPQHGLAIIPSVRERSMEVRQTRNGSNYYHVVLHVSVRFQAVDDPQDFYEVDAYGEGLDTSDKATAKALSAAFKYALLSTFTVPTEGVNEDADRTTPEETVQGKKQPEQPPEPQQIARVTSEQAAVLKAAYAASGGSEQAAFLTALSPRWGIAPIESFEDVPAKVYEWLLAQIKKKSKPKKAEKADA